MSGPALVELIIERPVAGGRMLARLDGQVVFVRGAIPGERVRARIERRQKGVLFAETIEVLDASPDRRAPRCHPACGGSAYVHIAIERQRTLKSEILRDAFARIGRITLDAPPAVAASPEDGYRMRARLHVRDAREGSLGFFLEGTHQLCDAASTGQLRADTLAAARDALRASPRAARARAVTVTENVPGTERAFLVEEADTDDTPAGLVVDDAVTDTAATLWHGAAPPIRPDVAWRRRVTSFFQGNRYLTGALVDAVLAEAGDGTDVVDLYAGGGLFSVAMAAQGRDVVAIESDPSSSRDLAENAAPFGERLRPLAATVEAGLDRSARNRPSLVVLDPPRIGASAEAIASIVALRAPRIVYVSCDPATLARDAAKIVAAGYAVRSVAGFDMFPNTAHVEAVARFDLPGA